MARVRTFFPLFDQPTLDPITGQAGMMAEGSAWERWYERIRELLHLHAVYSDSWTPVAVAANTVAEQAVTVTGVTTADIIYVTPPSITAGVGISSARVSAADTVQVAFVNPTAGSLTPPSGTYKFVTIRP